MMKIDTVETIVKAWGEEGIIANCKEYCAKWLYIEPMFVCSLHKHLIKKETFHVVAGEGVIEVAGEPIKVKVGDTIHIPTGVYHCFATVTGMTLLEVSTTHSDADVVRANASAALDEGKHRDIWNALGLPKS